MTTKDQFIDTVEEKFYSIQNRHLPKDTTLKKYYSNFKTVFKISFSEENPVIGIHYKWLYKTDTVLSAIEKIGSMLYQRDLLNVIKIVLKCFPHTEYIYDIYNEHDADLHVKVDQRYEDKNQNEQKVDLDSVASKYLQEYEKSITKPDKITNYQYYLIVMMYKEIPRRLEYCFVEFTNMEPKSDKSDRNYYFNKSFYFYVYKTVGLYGRQIIPVSDELAEIIETWRTLNKTRYLLVDPNNQNERITSSKLSQILIKKIGISATQIRHQFVTEKFKDDTSYKEKKHYASLLAHSVLTQQSIYRT